MSGRDPDVAIGMRDIAVRAFDESFQTKLDEVEESRWWASISGNNEGSRCEPLAYFDKHQHQSNNTHKKTRASSDAAPPKKQEQRQQQKQKEKQDFPRSKSPQQRTKSHKRTVSVKEKHDYKESESDHHPPIPTTIVLDFGQLEEQEKINSNNPGDEDDSLTKKSFRSFQTSKTTATRSSSVKKKSKRPSTTSAELSVRSKASVSSALPAPSSTTRRFSISSPPSTSSPKKLPKGSSAAFTKTGGGKSQKTSRSRSSSKQLKRQRSHSNPKLGASSSSPSAAIGIPKQITASTISFPVPTLITITISGGSGDDHSDKGENKKEKSNNKEQDQSTDNDQQQSRKRRSNSKQNSSAAAPPEPEHPSGKVPEPGKSLLCQTNNDNRWAHQPQQHQQESASRSPIKPRRSFAPAAAATSSAPAAPKSTLVVSKEPEVVSDSNNNKVQEDSSNNNNNKGKQRIFDSFLEQRKRDFIARIERAKEAIRNQEVRMAQKLKEKQQEEAFIMTMAPSSLSDNSTKNKTPYECALELYHMLGEPPRSTMKAMVQSQEPLLHITNITAEDLDLLPWHEDGWTVELPLAPPEGNNNNNNQAAAGADAPQTDRIVNYENYASPGDYNQSAADAPKSNNNSENDDDDDGVNVVDFSLEALGNENKSQDLVAADTKNGGNKQGKQEHVFVMGKKKKGSDPHHAREPHKTNSGDKRIKSERSGDTTSKNSSSSSHRGNLSVAKKMPSRKTRKTKSADNIYNDDDDDGFVVLDKRSPRISLRKAIVGDDKTVKSEAGRRSSHSGTSHKTSSNSIRRMALRTRSSSLPEMKTTDMTAGETKVDKDSASANVATNAATSRTRSRSLTTIAAVVDNETSKRSNRRTSGTMRHGGAKTETERPTEIIASPVPPRSPTRSPGGEPAVSLSSIIINENETLTPPLLHDETIKKVSRRDSYHLSCQERTNNKQSSCTSLGTLSTSNESTTARSTEDSVYVREVI